MALILRNEKITILGRGIGITGLFIFITGCMFMPEVDPESPEPNHAPKILINSLLPPDNGLFEVDLDGDRCEPLSFEIGQVRERNKRDTLLVGWFLDWQRGEDISPTYGWTPVLPAQEEIRGEIKQEFELEDLGTGIVHTLRVFIVDRPFIMSTEPDSDIFEFPEGEDGQYDTHQWTFRGEDGTGYCVRKNQ